MENEIQIKKMQRALQKRHPNWNQEKSRWLAMKALNIIK